MLGVCGGGGGGCGGGWLGVVVVVVVVVLGSRRLILAETLVQNGTAGAGRIGQPVLGSLG